MAKGKSQYCNWICTKKIKRSNQEKETPCNRVNYVTYYNKRSENIVKEKNKFCPTCRSHEVHKRKDTKKGN